MPAKTKKNKNKKGTAVSGAVAGTVSSLLLIAFYAILIDRNANTADYAKAVITAINIIGAIICGSSASKGRETGRLLPALLGGAIYFGVIIAAATAISVDNISTAGVCIIALIILVGSAVGSMLHLCKSNKKLRFKRNKR